MKNRPLVRISKRFYESRQLVLLFAPVLLHYLFFQYAPMFGLVVAFKDYDVFTGFLKSEWVGLKYFKLLFFDNPDFFPLLRNTSLLGFYSLLFGFPASIILALLLNEIRVVKFKRFVQTVSYLPHFLSNVIVASMILMLLSPDGGMVNQFLMLFGMEPIYFMSKPELFRPVFIISGIWQGAGWGSIIYLAGISDINPGLYEAAELDGAGRWGKIWNVTLPSLIPLITIMLILRIGNLFSTNFEKVILLYNPLTYSTADIFQTYTYRVGLQQAEFSYATAIGMFNGLVGFCLITVANFTVRKIRGSSLW